MKILHHPNEELRKIATDVSVFDEELRLLVEAMSEEMYAEDGIGLAAPQVGINKKIVIVDPSGGDDKNQFVAMINPLITSSSGKTISNEACLSLPGVFAEIERFETINVEFQTIIGEKVSLQLTGRQSIVAQHEIDHLNGILFTDHVKGIRKLTKRSVR